MAWGEVRVEDQRLKFIQEEERGIYSFSDLCNKYQISRKTGYKWIKRFKQEGVEGLKDKDRGPKNPKWKVTEEVVDQLVSAKLLFKWGPKKLRIWLKNNRPEIEWPAASTIGEYLKLCGLVQNRHIRKYIQALTTPFQNCEHVNDKWTIDFKGWVRTLDKQICEPLTIVDSYSRYILCCTQVYKKDSLYIQRIVERVFKDYGLPNSMRMDNGPPFGNLGVGGLTPFVIFLIKAGVLPEHIPPGKPQENGRHERMHLDLQKDVMSYPYKLNQMLDEIEEFVYLFNFERPHEALNNKTPSEIYQPSNRPWDGRLKTPEYNSEFKVYTICGGGQMHVKGQYIYVSRSLVKEPVGLKESEKGIEVYYGPLPLGFIKDNKVVGFK